MGNRVCGRAGVLAQMGRIGTDAVCERCSSYGETLTRALSCLMLVQLQVLTELILQTVCLLTLTMF